MSSKYNLVIVDDHPIVTEGLKYLFLESEDITITASFNRSSDLFTYSQLSKIQILLLDVFLPDMNGIDVCVKIKKLYPKILVLAISSQAERSIITQMIKSGASGYLLKSATIIEFKRCIKKAINGELGFSDEVKILMSKINTTDLHTIPRLTKREKEVISLLVKGKSTQEISDELFLSFLTVQTHRRNLLNKFNVKNVVELLNVVSKHALL